MELAPEIRPLTMEDINALSALIQRELAQPYSLYTYRFFLTTYPEQALAAVIGDRLVGCLIGRTETKKERQRAYLAMIVVENDVRRQGVGRLLFQKWMKALEGKVDEFVLQTECVNKTALRFYERLGFLRIKRMENYYTSGNDAFRLKKVVNI